MKFSYTLAAVFAATAVAAPVATIKDVPVDAGLLAKLSPDVAALVTGLGLTSLAPGLASTLITLSEGLKVRTDSTADIPVDAGLLAKLSPDVAALVTGLGLTSLAPGLAATLITLSEGLKTRQLEGVVNTVETVTAPVTGVVADLTKPIGGVAPVAGVVGARQLEGVVNTVETVTAPVTGALADLTKPLGGVAPVAGAVGARDLADIPVDAGLLAKLSPDVAALVTGLGLTSLAPGLAATLITLSEGLKARQVPDVAAELQPALEAIIGQVTGTVEDKVVPTVQGTVENVVPAVSATIESATGAVGAVGARDLADIPVDAGLLAKLSPDVAALVTGLGLTSLAPGLASTLITLSEGLKVRTDSPVPDIPVDAGLLAKLSPDVAALVSGLGLTSIAPGLAATLVTLSEGLKTRQLEGVVNTVETVTAPVTGVVADLLKPVGGVTVPVTGAAEPATGVVSSIAGAVGARQLPEVPVAGDLLKPVGDLVSGLAGGVVSTRQSSDPLATVTQALEAILGHVTDVVSGVVAPVEATVGQAAAPVGAIVGAVGARQSSDPLAKATQALEGVLGKVTDVVSGVVAPVESTVGQAAAPVGAVVGAVGARDALSSDEVVAKVNELLKGFAGTADATEIAKKVAGSVPVDAGLLAQLSAPIAALVSGLGLTSLAPGLAATLITLSQGL